MDRVIAELRACNEEVPVPLELPDMDDIIDAEEQLLVGLDNEFRQFMLTVSDVIYGTLEPVTVADPSAHTYLPEVAAMAWSLGIPNFNSALRRPRQLLLYQRNRRSGLLERRCRYR